MNVTYVHDGKRPDLTTRGVSFEVHDADGFASVPAAVLVDVVPVNNPAVLDLSGLHRPGTDYVVSMGENERFLGVSLTDADLFLGDDDGQLIVGGRIAYEGVFPDGSEAEYVEVSGTRGTSVVGAWNPVAQSFELQGSDTLSAYRGILASARYVNKGKVQLVMNQLPITGSYSSRRVIARFGSEIQDSGGAITTARSTVTVREVERVGDPTRDENLRTPKSAAGSVEETLDELGTGDPETCICNLGHAGDECEIHPCNYRGSLAAMDENGMLTCSPCERELEATRVRSSAAERGA